ncbi:MAG TPA: hypothetical protein VK771_09450 [Acidimicrobiia bacterium]|nr:hypothetical protein [Acidimicrobiia bacterium]
MTRGWGVGRRCGIVVGALAVLIMCSAPAFVAPAGATNAAKHKGVAVTLRGRAVKPKPKKKKAATGRLGKRDYAEFALLVLAPFVVMGLFLYVSGYRRESRASHGP